MYWCVVKNLLSLTTAVLLMFTDEDIQEQNIQEVDAKHEVSAIDTDTYNMQYDTASPSDDNGDVSDDIGGQQGACPPNNYVSCPVCQTVLHRNSLARHMLLHNRERLYACDLCDLQFISRSKLKMHKCKYKRSVQPFACDTCDLRFSDKVQLDAHEQSHCDRSSADNSGQRSYCTAKNKSQLKTVINKDETIRTGAQSFTCCICYSKFSQLSDLKKHVCVSSTELPYACDICSRKFLYLENLTQHVNYTHGCERPFACSLCSGRFSKPGDLKRHIAIHSNERPYGCDVCSKKFKDPCHLKCHKLTHINRKKNQAWTKQNNLRTTCGWTPLYTVFRKKHPLTFSFISPWIICGFKQKSQRIHPRIDRFWQCKN